jgi:REP element-mobilizing transposase RayT
MDTFHYGEQQLHFYRLRAWVLMANHVHLLIYPEIGLPRITESVKSYPARQAHAILRRTGLPFWQDESHDHWVRGTDELARIVRYIERNPLVAGLVTRPEDWPRSSAFEQAGRPVPPDYSAGAK